MNPELKRESQTMFQCLCCENWLHESCTSLRPSRQGDDIDATNRQLANGPLIDYDSFDLFICSECVCKPGNEILKQYLGSTGWMVCLPAESSVKGIPSITVEAKGDAWTQSWKVYGLLAQDEASAQPVPLLKRKAEDDEPARSASKRAREEDTLLESTINTEKAQGAALDRKVDTCHGRTCTVPTGALISFPHTGRARLDVFLADDFRERFCRCEQVS